MIAAIAIGCFLASGAPSPNIVVILADDQGWGDLGIHGNTAARTPHLDSLARQGARFDRFFVQPVCAPTRAEFLTGRWHPRGGVHGVSTGAERLDLDERTIADFLRQSGYATGCFGKWHNGSQFPYHPLGRGFGEYYGYTSGHWGDYYSPPLDHNGQAAKVDYYSRNLIVTGDVGGGRQFRGNVGYREQSEFTGQTGSDDNRFFRAYSVYSSPYMGQAAYNPLRASQDERRAIVEILRDTKNDLPGYFDPAEVH